jgi:hypothetical protein
MGQEGAMTERPDPLIGQLARFEGSVDAWLRKTAMIRRVSWDRVETVEDCVAANDLLLDVLFGQAFYPSAFNAALAENPLTTPERERCFARIRSKLALDGSEFMRFAAGYREALENAFSRHMAEGETP